MACSVAAYSGASLPCTRLGTTTESSGNVSTTGKHLAVGKTASSRIQYPQSMYQLSANEYCEVRHTTAGNLRWPLRRQMRLTTAAKRKESVPAVTDDELDEDLKAGLNEVSNEAIRVMLSEDIQQVLALKKKVDYLGDFLVGEGELEAARFMLVLKGMLEHVVPTEADDLTGAYKKAFEKIGSIMEDSGWSLLPPDEEQPAAMQMVDDELIPPVLRPY